MERWPQYYILMDRVPIAVDFQTWVEGYAKRAKALKTTGVDPWRVARDDLDGCYVSTVFLGLDHSFSDRGDPVLFETMVFSGPLDQEQQRYTSWADAERGHAEIVVEARKAVAAVKAIARAAGASETNGSR